METRHSEQSGYSRRQFSRMVVGSAAGLLVAAAAGDAEPQEAEIPSNRPEDPRVGQLEKARGVPLTPEQRKRIPGQLSDLDKSAVEAHKFPLSDGGSEPCFVFKPEVGSVPSLPDRTKAGRIPIV